MRSTKARDGLVESHQAFILDQVIRLCRRYRWLDYSETQKEAFRLAHIAAGKFDPSRGVSFRTFLNHHLKGLHRFAERRRQESDYALSESELAKRRREQRIRRNLKFPEGDGARLTIDRSQRSGRRHRRALVRARLPHKQLADALHTAERISVGLKAVNLADPDVIKARFKLQPVTRSPPTFIVLRMPNHNSKRHLNGSVGPMGLLN
jgi:hypothetical protein